MNPAFVEQLFVYGLLRPDDAPVAIRPAIEDAEDLGEASIRGKLFNVHNKFPAAVEGDGVIHGHLLRWTSVVDWQTLDHWEGCDRNPPLYYRTVTRVTLAPGHLLDAWVYWWQGSSEGLKHLPTGYWSQTP